MNKVEKINPATGNVASNRVVVNNKIFQEIINAVNTNAETTNKIIDVVALLEQKITDLTKGTNDKFEEVLSAIDSIKASVSKNENNLTSLAKAVATLQGIN